MSDHSKSSPSRFSSATVSNPAYRIIYLGGSHQVGIYEVSALLGNPIAPIPNPVGSWVILSLKIVLNNIVDLSELSQQKIISTNHAELTGKWLNYPGEAPTQQLGRALYNLPGCEGFIYRSALVDGLCLGVFPDKLGPTSSIGFFNEISNRTEKLT